MSQDFYRACARKKVHTRKSAQATIDAIVARGGASGHLYQCDFGHHWHISASQPTPWPKYHIRAEQRAQRGLDTPGGPR